MGIRGFFPKFLNVWIVAGALLASGVARAEEFHELYQGAKSLGMGGACTAIVDDYESVFLNPAGLAAVKKFQMNYLPVNSQVSKDTVTTATSSLSSINGASGTVINKLLMGKDISGRVQITPTMVAPYLGFGIISDGQFAIRAKNQALPQIEMGYQTTNGIQGAVGIPLLKQRRARDDLRIGFAGKMLWRRGGYQTLSLDRLYNLNKNTLGQIAGNYRLGYGVDVGSQYVRKVNKRLSLMFGTAYTDIGDTTFGPGVDPQRNNLSVGMGASYQSAQALKITFAYDYKHLLDVTDWRKRNHFGIWLSFPVFDIYGGFNQTSLTYGIDFDLFFFKVTALSYAEEQGVYAFQDPERRYLLRLDLKFGL